MARLIDTGVLIGLERRDQSLKAVDRLLVSESTAIASITASELLVGVHRAIPPERRLRRETFVEAVLARMRILPFDLAVARTHARVWAELAGLGQLIEPNDLLIAATALTHGYEVLTLNVRDFERVPGLVVHQPNW